MKNFSDFRAGVFNFKFTNFSNKKIKLILLTKYFFYGRQHGRMKLSEVFESDDASSIQIRGRLHLTHTGGLETRR